MQDTLWGEEECIPLQRKPRLTMQAHHESEQQTGALLSTCVSYILFTICIVPKSKEFSDTVLMELPAGLFGGSSWDGHDTTRCGSSRAQLSVCIKGKRKLKVCILEKAIVTVARSTTLLKRRAYSHYVCLCT
jgi:hypothetical protein